jgi:hypothetical protein
MLASEQGAAKYQGGESRQGAADGQGGEDLQGGESQGAANGQGGEDLQGAAKQPGWRQAGWRPGCGQGDGQGAESRQGSVSETCRVIMLGMPNCQPREPNSGNAETIGAEYAPAEYRRPPDIGAGQHT